MFSTATFSVIAVHLFLQVHALCPPGAMQGRTTAECFSFQSTPAKYNIAVEACASKQLGGVLTSVDSVFESFRVNNVAKLANGPYWIGLSGSEVWYWEDEADLNYTNWARGEPKVANPNVTYCVAVDSQDRKWHVQDCKKTLPYVCKVPPVDLPKSPGSAPSSDLQCQDGWTYVDDSNKCYKAMPYEDRKPWYDAVALCRALGGDLAKIPSNRTLQAVSEKVMEPDVFYSIGLYSPKRCTPYDQIHPCVWEWTDGEPLGWDAWLSFAPPYAHLEGYCVLMVHNTVEPSDPIYWVTSNCEYHYPYICEMPVRTGFK
ncbi:MRC1L-E protein [Aphelenchoides avenae]|nr:MRC1L-E protein [Aphelenchus avenae]